MADEYVKLNLHYLLAGLTGDESRMWHMAYTIKPEHVPGDLPFEKEYLQVLWDIQIAGGTPTREQVIASIGIRNPKMEQIAERVDEILGYQTPGRDIASPSHFLANWLNEQAAKSGLQQALAIMDSGYGTAEERYAQALRKIEFVPRSANQQITNTERHDMAVEELRKLRQRYESGAPLGAYLPIKGLRDLVPVLMPGDLCLYKGPTGGGKTTIATLQAMYNAWGNEMYISSQRKQQNEFAGCVPVLLIHLETSHLSLQHRQWARFLNLPVKYVRTAAFDPDCGEWKERLHNFRTWAELMEKERAPIIYYHAPDASNQEIEKAVYLFSEICKAQNVTGEVIVDYLQKMQMNKGFQPQESLAINAEHLKNLAERYMLHVTSFSQQNDDGEAYGSRQSEHKAQVVVAVERKKAEVNKPMLAPNEKPVLDALGNKRFWHKAGHWEAETILRVTKANDDEPGYTKVWFDGGRFDIQE